MSFVKCLDCSTSHIPKSDAEKFSDIAQSDDIRTAVGLPRIAKHMYGYVFFLGSVEFERFFHIEDGQEEVEYAELRKDCNVLGLSLAIEELLKYARANGCSMINLDADGEVIKGLPVFEW